MLLRRAISPLFHNISAYLYFQESNYIFICEMWLFDLSFFLNSENLICRDTDISKYFKESLGLRDNESRLYFHSRCIACLQGVFPFLYLCQRMTNLQNGRPPSLIRVFAVRMDLKLIIERTAKTDQTGWIHRLI